MKLLLSVFLLLQLVAAPSVALGEDLYKVKDFEFFGTRLGDDANEIIDGLTNHLSVKAEDLDLVRESWNNNAIANIDYESDGIRIVTYLPPDPAAEGDLPYALYAMTVELQSGDYTQYLQEFTNKYGPPSITHSATSHSWCEKVEERDTIKECALHTDRLKISGRSGDSIFFMLYDDYYP